MGIEILSRKRGGGPEQKTEIVDPEQKTEIVDPHVMKSQIELINHEKIDSIKYLKVEMIENQKEVRRCSSRERCCGRGAACRRASRKRCGTGRGRRSREAMAEQVAGGEQTSW